MHAVGETGQKGHTIRHLNNGISGACFPRIRALHLDSQTLNQATTLQALFFCLRYNSTIVTTMLWPMPLLDPEHLER